MPPKMPSTQAAEIVEEQVVEEEEEEGEGRIAFHISVSSVSHLPCDLETFVEFSGVCRKNRSSSASVSSSSSSPCFDFPKDRFIRRSNQTLYDDLVSHPLVVCLHDAGNDDALVGQASISCLPLLHEELEVGGDVELELAPTYHRKWWPELDQADQEAVSKDKKATAKAKGKDKKNVEALQETPVEITKRPNDFVPPKTLITVHVRVAELVGPLEDRGAWTTLSFQLKGVFSLPERLTMLGLTGLADDIEAHQLKYRATMFGESLVDGALARPIASCPQPASADVNEKAVDQGTSEEEWCEQQEQVSQAVRFKEHIIRYRGSKFLKEFRYMLNNVGGIWMYFAPQEKTPSDPKKPNLPEAGALAKHFSGKAWVDLRGFLQPGNLSVEKRCKLRSTCADEDILPGEPTLQDAHSFVRLALELRFAAAPHPRPCIEDLRLLAPTFAAANTYPTSTDAATIYQEAIDISFKAVCQDCDSSTQGVAGAVAQLKKRGNYDDLRESLRGAVVRVFRERLRKDTHAVPGKILQGKVRDELISSTYGYLKETAVSVLDEIRCHEQARVASMAELEEKQRQQQEQQQQHQQQSQQHQQQQQQQQQQRQASLLEVVANMSDVAVAYGRNLTVFYAYPTFAALVAAVVIFTYGDRGIASVCAIMCYIAALSSIKLTVKWVFVHHNYSFAKFVTATHFTFGALLSYGFLRFRQKEFPIPTLKEFWLMIFPVSLAIAISVSAGNMALVHSSAAFTEIIGSTSCLFTALMVVLLGMPFQTSLLLPMLIVIFGAVVSTAGEIHFSLLGLLLCCIANAFRSLKVAMQQKLMTGETKDKFDPVALLFWSSVPSIFVMLAASAFSEGAEPYRQLAALEAGKRWSLVRAILVTCVNATILNLTQLFVNKDLGAVGSQLVAQAKSVLTILGSVAILGEIVSRMELFGFTLVLLGVYLYSWMDRKPQQKQDVEPPRGHVSWTPGR